MRENINAYKILVKKKGRNKQSNKERKKEKKKEINKQQKIIPESSSSNRSG
jgi:hypothetical protein